MQHHQIIFNINALDMVQIFKPMLMVLNLYKTDVIFQIYYLTENMNRNRNFLGKGIRMNSHAVWNHTALLTRQRQNHRQSAIM